MQVEIKSFERGQVFLPSKNNVRIYKLKLTLLVVENTRIENRILE